MSLNNLDKHEHPLLENLLGYLLNRSLSSVRIWFVKKLKTHNILLHEWFVLMALYEQDGQSVNDLIESSLLAQPTLTKILARLEDRKLIVRKLNPNDNRIKENVITKRGKQVVNSLIKDNSELEELALSGLKNDEKKLLFQCLKKITLNLQK